MGKLSEALKKSMQEREKQRKLQEEERQRSLKTKASTNDTEALKTSQKIVENVDFVDKEQNREERIKSRIISWKERFTDYAKSATYVAKAKDGSGIDPRVICYYNYQSPIADQYRIIRTNLKSYFKNAPSFSKATASSAHTRILSFSSALHGEGKTITAANLAVVLAHDLDAKVLLFDCDLRRGLIHKLFNIDASCGLRDILAEGLDYRKAIHPTKINNLFVLPSGKNSPKPLELLSSKRMKLLFEQLRAESFNYIIIDTPPLSLFSDAGVVGAESDGIVFVVQAHKTPVQVIKRAKELAERSHAKIIGFILTHTDYHIPHVYGYHQYYKYYSRSQH